MLLSLDVPPKSADPLFWTDFAELKAVIHPDRCFSRGDLTSLLRRNRDTSVDRSGNDETRWRDIVTFASTRVSTFGNDYPFHISEDQDTLILHENLSDGQGGYLKLLLSSLMRHIPNPHRGELARFFESVSLEVFSQLMPPGSEVHPNWANGGDAARYRGTLFQKMQAVAEDIRCNPNFEERDFKANDTGDGGIDIVAWHPMADEREGMPIAFAQCGCSKEDWKFKQLEASYFKHSRNLPVMHPWGCYYFMPLDLRHADGQWAYKSDIGPAVIVDRLRILRLSSQHGLLANWPGLPLLDQVKALACP
jgi:hypothetical protein